MEINFNATIKGNTISATNRILIDAAWFGRG
jgi:hypothetical protein